MKKLEEIEREIRQIIFENSDLTIIDNDTPFLYLGLSSLEIVFTTELLSNKFKNCFIDIRHIYEDTTNTIKKLSLYIYDQIQAPLNKNSLFLSFFNINETKKISSEISKKYCAFIKSIPYCSAKAFYTPSSMKPEF